MLALCIILAHLVGDYLIQSDWMANEKTKRWWPAIAHGLSYSIPYAVVLVFVAGFDLPRTLLALLVIGGTHIIIDRYRLARHLAWFKNQAAPKAYRSHWADCKGTGYPADKPPFMAVWLMIIADNTVHLIINAATIYLLA